MNGTSFCRYNIATISRALKNESCPGQDTSVAYKTTYGQHYHQLDTVREEKITGQSSQEMDVRDRLILEIHHLAENNKEPTDFEAAC